MKIPFYTLLHITSFWIHKNYSNTPLVLSVKMILLGLQILQQALIVRKVSYQQKGHHKFLNNSASAGHRSHGILIRKKIIIITVYYFTHILIQG